VPTILFSRLHIVLNKYLSARRKIHKNEKRQLSKLGFSLNNGNQYLLIRIGLRYEIKHNVRHVVEVVKVEAHTVLVEKGLNLTTILGAAL